eukprot:152064-Pyramimonas_sp.AAC.1
MALRLRRRRRRRRMQHRRGCRSRRRSKHRWANELRSDGQTRIRFGISPRKAWPWQSFGTGSRPVSNKYIAASCKFGMRRFGLTHGQSDCAALG